MGFFLNGRHGSKSCKIYCMQSLAGTHKDMILCKEDNTRQIDICLVFCQSNISEQVL